MRITLPLSYWFILYSQIRLNDFTRSTRQRCWWINVNDVCYNSSTTEFRSISGHYLFHIVSRIPHLRVRQALRSVICFGYCSVISRFRFSLSFLPLPLSLLKGMHCAFTILERSQGIGDTMDNRYTYLIKDHCRVESLRRRMANGISLITNLELQLSTLSRSPVFSNLSYFFQGSFFAFITKFYNLINFWSIRSSFVLPYRIYRYIYIY